MKRHFCILLALGTLCRAWRANFSEATQCENVTVTWSGSEGELLGPPFVVRMAAFELAPLIIQIPTSAWSNSARAGSYSFAMPWLGGTKFVASMDDGYGTGTGGVTGIQTVKSSSNSGCVSTSITQPEHVFDIRGPFFQCSTVSMNWTEPATSGTRISGLVPNGVAFHLDPPVTNTKSTTWDLNILTGTAFVLMYIDASGSGLTSPLLLSIGDGSNKQCLASGVYPSATASQTGVSTASGLQPSASSTTPSATQTSGADSGSNLGPILGGAFGALGFLIVLGLALCLAIRRRRRNRVPPPLPAKEVNLDAEETLLGGQNAGSNPHHPNGAIVLPYVLPRDSPSQQDNHLSAQRNPTSGKHTARQPSRDMTNASESSYEYGTSASQSSAPFVPASQTYTPGDEPMFIRHEDGGAVPLQRVREIIELPPNYDQLPSPPPPPQTQQAVAPPRRKLGSNN